MEFYLDIDDEGVVPISFDIADSALYRLAHALGYAFSRDYLNELESAPNTVRQRLEAFLETV